MQDKAITEIGKWELKRVANMDPYQLYIENMFPGKYNYDIKVLVFELHLEDNKYVCRIVGIESEEVSKGNFLIYSYRKGLARGGDVTFTTKFGDIEKKVNSLVDTQFKNWWWFKKYDAWLYVYFGS